MKLFDKLLATKRKFRCEKMRIWAEMTRHQKAGANSPVVKSIKRLSSLLNGTQWSVKSKQNIAIIQAEMPKSKVWKYFGFTKVKEGPPVKENLDMLKTYCRLRSCHVGDRDLSFYLPFLFDKATYGQNVLKILFLLGFNLFLRQQINVYTSNGLKQEYDVGTTRYYYIYALHTLVKKVHISRLLVDHRSLVQNR